MIGDIVRKAVQDAAKTITRNIESFPKEERLRKLCSTGSLDAVVDVDKIYETIKVLIEKDPYLVHTTLFDNNNSSNNNIDDDDDNDDEMGNNNNNNGYTPLQLICCNPTLASHLKLIKFLVETSSKLSDSMPIEDDYDDTIPELDLSTGSTDSNGSGRLSSFGRPLSKLKNTIVSQSPSLFLTNSTGLLKLSSLATPPTAIKSLSTSISNNNNDNDNNRNNKNSIVITPSNALVLRQKTKYGETILHLVCQNSNISIDVMEYLILLYPTAVCIQDIKHKNTPLHNLCISCTKYCIQLESIILLLQQWPDSCKIQNHSGNLPIHLAVQQQYAWIDENDNNNDQHNAVTSIATNELTNNSNRNTNNIDCRYQKQQRQQLQLIIIHYLVNYYKDSLFIKNYQGYTPVRLAFLSMVSCGQYKNPIYDYLKNCHQQHRRRQQQQQHPRK